MSKIRTQVLRTIQINNLTFYLFRNRSRRFSVTVFMNKTVFARDYAAIDREIERLRPLIALGGYIPCPDHRIAPDAKFENVQYYCERLASLSL